MMHIVGVSIKKGSMVRGEGLIKDHDSHRLDIQISLEQVQST